jgi:isomerase DpgB
MVTGEEMREAAGVVSATGARVGIDGLVIQVDGRRPLSAESVAAIAAVCDSAEGRPGGSGVIVHVSGAPDGPSARDLSVALVNRWERVLRRLERLPATTVAVAAGDCGGTALDALLATDYRIAAAPVRLLVPVEAGATWPGMALYRLAQQAGAAAIRRAVLFGMPIEAGDALALHLVDELADDAASAVTAAAGLIGAFSGAELAIRRQLMLDAPTVRFEDALGAHLAACDRALRRVSAGAPP